MPETPTQPTRLNHLLSGLFQKQFADPCCEVRGQRESRGAGSGVKD